MYAQVVDLLKIIEDFIPTIFFSEVQVSESDVQEHSNIKEGSFVDKEKNFVFCSHNKQISKYTFDRRNKEVGDITLFESLLVQSLLDKLWDLLGTEKSNLKSISPFNVQLALCEFINKRKTYVENIEELNLLINNLDIWSRRTYEGERVEMVYVFANTKDIPSLVDDGVDINDVIMKDFMAPITDFGQSAILLDRFCNIIGHFSLTNNKNSTDYSSPYNINNFLNSIMKKDGYNDCLVIALINNGDILLIREGKLQFAKRRGQWYIFNDTILNNLFSKKQKRLAKKLYNAVVDASFAHTGVCISVWNIDIDELTEDNMHQILDKVNIHDVYNSRLKTSLAEYYLKINKKPVEEDPNEIKRMAFRKILGSEENEFDITKESFSRKKLQEILGIDGATILDKKGRIIAAGAIVKVEGGSASGGRLAAAKSLAKYGISIKVSEDGTITGFRGIECDSPIFTLG